MKYAMKQQRFCWQGPPRGWWSVVALGCLLAGFLLGGAPNAYGQAIINASLTGSVLDSSGAAVPEAAVTLTDPSKGFSRSQTTSNDGHYAFTLIPASTYNLRVEKSGFRAYVQTGIILTVGAAVTQDVTLEVGAVTQEVKVTAAAPMLNTTNANMGSEVTERQVKELPLNWRNVIALVHLDSSVTDGSFAQVVGTSFNQSDQDISFFNIAGGRFGTTAFLLDGHWDGTGDWGAVLFVPGVDEVQEFKVQTHSFSAQYGWSFGSYLNIITKSGTSDFHGSAFGFMRNSALDANNFFNNKYGIARPNSKRQQFGFTAGGPLYIPKLFEQRNKLFIFGGYEGLRTKTPDTNVMTIPTAANRTGDFSANLGEVIGTDALGRPIYSGAIYDPFTTRTVTAGTVDATTGLTPTASGYVRDPFGATAGNGWVPTNVIPSGRFDPIAASLLGYWPSPTNNDLVNNYTVGAVLPNTIDRYSIRGDFNATEKDRMFGRWSYERIHRRITGQLFGADNVGGPGSDTVNNRYDAGMGYNRTFTPTFVMSLNAGMNWWVEGYRPQGWGTLPSSLGLPAAMDVVPEFAGIGIDDMTGLGSGGWSNTPRYTGTLAADFTKVHGAHTMNFGFMGIALYQYSQIIDPSYFNFGRDMTSGGDPTAADVSTGAGFASFLLGTSSGGAVPVTAAASFIKKYAGWYFQDDWKVNRKLTLNLGIRYDFQTAPTERFDRMWNFNFTDPNPISSDVGFTVPGFLVPRAGANSRSLYQRQNTNIAPRIGFSYRLTDKLVMRAGFGLFYIPAIEMSDYQGITLYGFSQTTPMVATLDGITPYNLLSDPYPDGLIQPIGNALGGLQQVGQSVNAIEPYRPTPYNQMWSLGFQYQLGPNDNLEATYVGHRAVRLHLSEWALQANQLTEADLALGSALFDMVENPFYGYISSSACGLDQETVQRSQLLRPYPQYCGVTNAQPPQGFSTYNALMMTYNHRWSQGLQVLASFTLSKWIDDSSGPGGWATRGGSGIVNSYNLAAEKSLDKSDQTKSLVVSYIYELPYGRGKKFGANSNRFANAILGGWQFSGVTTLKDGFPLPITSAVNNTNAGSSQQRPNLVGDPHLSNRSIDAWFDPAAFVQPDAYTFGDTPRTMPNLRSPGLVNFDINIQKYWKWKEKLSVEYRAEMFNAFNTPWLYAPRCYYGASNFEKIISAGSPRTIQMSLKIYW